MQFSYRLNPRFTRAVILLLSSYALALSLWVLLQDKSIKAAIKGGPAYYHASSGAVLAGGPAESFLLPFSLRLLGQAPGLLLLSIRVYALAAVLASALALVLALRPRQVPAALQLGLALSTIAFFAAHFVLSRHVALLAIPVREFLDYAGMVAFAFGVGALIKVAFNYPQPVDIDAYLAFTQRMETNSWAHRFVRGIYDACRLTAAYDKLDSLAGSATGSSLRMVRSVWWSRGLALLGCTLVALLQWHGPAMWMFLTGFTPLLVITGLTWVFGLGAMEWQYRMGNAEDRARITWLVLGFVIFFWLWSTFFMGVMVWLLCGGSEVAGQLMMTAFALALPVGAIVLVLLLTCSIFFFGAFDPRMAIRKTSVYGIAALLLTVALAAAQSSLVSRIVSRLNLPGQSGSVFAGAMVALVFAPMRKRIETRVERTVDRVLPASTLAEAHRETVTVVFCDLSGYTELSAKDEPKALTLASLLHKESRRLAERHGGRLVKTIGDAVLLAFREPGEAVVACIELREKFAVAATALSLPTLPLHFGLHAGEVVRDKDGDIFGGTVNLAARLQGVAQASEIVVSDSVAAALAQGNFTLRSLGAKSLKNVPALVGCFLVV